MGVGEEVTVTEEDEKDMGVGEEATVTEAEHTVMGYCRQDRPQ